MTFIKIVIPIMVACLCFSSQAETLTPEKVLQKVIDHYPSVNIAAIEIERARQSLSVANSRLGWQLEAQAGIERGVSIFGTASDTLSLGGGVSRLLESGSSFTVDGRIRREDSDSVISPGIPNPATTSNLGVSLRQSLGQNKSLSSLESERTAAKIDLQSTLAERDEVYDQLALEVINLYFSAAVLLARIDNIDQSIVRAKRLQLYINNRTSLGVSEEKDILQVNAQLDSLVSEKKSLETTWVKQMVSLNRLMERPWDAEISTRYKINSDLHDYDALLALAKNHSPHISLLESKLALADSTIRTRRDERESSVDLIWFAGSQNYQGDSLTGSVSETELTGGLRLEYKDELDKSGVDATLYQAQLERSSILQDTKLLLENIRYDLSSVLAELKANKSAMKAFEKSLESESIKVDEALKRYKSGRIDTDVLISFEDQLTQARFSLELQRISLAQRHYKLQIMTGQLWHKIQKPEYLGFLSDSANEVGAR